MIWVSKRIRIERLNGMPSFQSDSSSSNLVWQKSTTENRMRATKFQMNKLWEWFWFYVDAHTCESDRSKILSTIKSIKQKPRREDENKIIKIAINSIPLYEICWRRFRHTYTHLKFGTISKPQLFQQTFQIIRFKCVRCTMLYIHFDVMVTNWYFE